MVGLGNMGGRMARRLNLGYGDQTSNRVVDAIGDAAGGVRVSDSGNQSTEG